jgi:hypothetical protein
MSEPVCATSSELSTATTDARPSRAYPDRMRALLALALLPLLACEPPPAPRAPAGRQLTTADVEQAQARREREHQEREGASQELHRDQATAERIERDGAAHPSPAPAPPPARYVAPPGKAEGDRIMQGILQDAGAAPPPSPAAPDLFQRRLFRDLSPRSPQAVAVAEVWAAWGRLPRERRTPQAFVDAGKESESVGGREAEASYVETKLSRRAFADIVMEGSLTAGDLDDIWWPALEWDECLTRARQTLASVHHRGALDAMGFVQVACIKLRESSVTGNLITDSEKRWPVKR